MGNGQPRSRSAREWLSQSPAGWDGDAEGLAAALRGALRGEVGFDADAALLEATGLEVELLDSGCCGMAGSFGFERGRKYEVSQAAAERVLLPAVRGAPDDTWIVADGFSCREQVAQATGRRPLHLAELLQRDLERARR